MKKNKNTLIKQLCDFGIGPIIGMFISLITVPITTRLIAPLEYGKSALFTLFQSIFLIIGLFGFDQGYVRYYNQEKNNKTGLFQNAIFFPIIFSFFLIVLSLLFIRPISNFLFGSVEFFLMFALCVYMPILVLNRFFFLQLRLDLRGKLYSSLNVVTQVLNFAFLVLLLLFYQKSFRSIIFANIISTSISTFICFLFCDKEFLRKKFIYSKSLQIDLFKFGFPIIPATILSWVMNSFDKVALRTWCNFEELGLYTAAFKIVAIFNIVQTIFSTTWVPVAYKWYEAKVSKKKFENVSTLIMSTMTILFSIVVLLRNILLVFLGEEYRGTEKIFVFLLFAPVLQTVSEVSCTGINFSNKTIYNVYVGLFSTLLNLFGNYILVPKYGALGAAVSTCACYILFFVLRTYFSNKLFYKFKIEKYVVNIILLLLLCLNICVYNNLLFEIIIFLLILLFNAFLLVKLYYGNKNLKKNTNIEVEE